MRILFNFDEKLAANATLVSYRNFPLLEVLAGVDQEKNDEKKK